MLTRLKPNKREQILTAIKVIGHFGYDSTTIDKIAVEVGVSSALVTKHFCSKEGGSPVSASIGSAKP